VAVTGGTLHPDLAAPEHKVLLEADSWEIHTGKKAHRRDCWRYNEFVALGWTLLRLTWWHVMEDPDFVVEVLSRVHGRPLRRAGVPGKRSQRHGRTRRHVVSTGSPSSRQGG
jgi:very-short-patch-repair endonuclease